VRIAWYDRPSGRPKQFAISDTRLVRAGETVTLEVPLDAPPGAIAYRIRVLARMRLPEAVSTPDAVRATLSAPVDRLAYPLTRLLP
jgi:lipid A disaccharide synthetase